jgi:hypothetical protein
MIEVDEHAKHIRWVKRSHGYLPRDELLSVVDNLTMDSPWSVLCTERFEDNTTTAQHSNARHQFENDHRLAVWLHHKLLLHPEHGEYLAKVFDYATVQTMTARGRYIMAIYIYDVQADGPVVVLHPHQHLKEICDSLPGKDISGHSSGVTIEMEHVLRLMPNVVAHAHYKRLASFVRIMKGTTIKQV